jgi:hypothetical protein
MVEGGNRLARNHAPELGGFIRTRRQDPTAIRTKCCVVDDILMAKRGDNLS